MHMIYKSTTLDLNPKSIRAWVQGFFYLLYWLLPAKKEAGDKRIDEASNNISNSKITST